MVGGFETNAFLAGAAFIILLISALRKPPSWLVFALLGAGFAGWSVHAVVTEGPLGFWPEHIRNAWGNQIWFDLLLAAAIAWTVLVPRMRAAGMRPLPWLVLVVCTGSIGLCATVARCLFLESRARNGGGLR